MVIIATSVVKVWLKKSPVSLIEPKDSSVGAPSPTTSISMPQFITLLFFMILINLAVMHYQTITHPLLAIGCQPLSSFSKYVWMLNFMNSISWYVNSGIFCQLECSHWFCPDFSSGLMKMCTQWAGYWAGYWATKWPRSDPFLIFGQWNQISFLTFVYVPKSDSKSK